MLHDSGIEFALEGPADAPVLVLSNSLGTTRQMWAPQRDALTRHYRVLSYDTRGHGGSGVPPAPYSLEALGRDVLSLLDELDIERAHFCGISMGGLTGQWLAVHAPERIGKLVIADTAARIGTVEGWRSRAQLVRSQGMADVAAGAAGRWFTADFIAREPAVVTAMTDALRAISPEGYAACCDVLAVADLRESIGAIKAPLLVVAGEFDPVTTVEDARFIAERVQGAQVVVVPASHLSNIEAPDAFNSAVLDFLKA